MKLDIKNNGSTNNKQVSYVSWKVFSWSMAIVLILFGTVFNLFIKTDTKVETFNRDMIEIRVQLSQIQADLIWIKANLSK